MDKDEVKDFFRFLETASRKERQERQESLVTTLGLVTDIDVKRDCYFLVKHIEDSLIADLQSEPLDTLDVKLQRARALRTKLVHRKTRQAISLYIEKLERMLLK